MSRLAGAIALAVLTNLPARGESDRSCPRPDHFQAAVAAETLSNLTKPTMEPARDSDLLGCLRPTSGDFDPALVVTSPEIVTSESAPADLPITLHAGYGQFFPKEDLGLPATNDGIEFPSWLYIKVGITF